MSETDMDDLDGRTFDSSVIRVDGLSKCYQIFDHPRGRLLHALGFVRLVRHHEHWALRGVSFAVAAGEAVGIIGLNGSGKTTLLQLIAGTLDPTAGTVAVSGRVAALLELGSGFNPEFTGRENVYLNGAVLRLSRRSVDARFEAIAEFADIGEFMDKPVKTYSSGMVMRLAFAVQTAVEPDVLIVDEALSVGDVFFQQKCARRMRELREKGTTLLFVSHDMAVVRDLCEKALYLRAGEAVFFGDVRRAINLYFNQGAAPAAAPPAVSSLDPSDSDVPELFRPRSFWMGAAQPEVADGSGALIRGVAVVDSAGEPVSGARMGGDLVFRVLLRHLSAEPVHVAVSLKNRFDQGIAVFGSYLSGMDAVSGRPGDYTVCELKMSAMLEAGQYSFQVSVGRPGDYRPNRGRPDDRTPWLGPLSILWDYENQRAPFLGMFGVPVEVRFRSVDEIFRRAACK